MEIFMLLLQLHVFSALCRAYCGVKHQPQPAPVLTKAERVAEGRGSSPRVDVVCLNDDRNIK